MRMGGAQEKGVRLAGAVQVVRVASQAGDEAPVTRVTDFVSGMTDRYALRTYREIFEPKEGPL